MAVWRFIFSVPVLLAVALCGGKEARGDTEVRRIVSLAPTLTEVLFAIGAGDKVVGVTRYCDYPPQATTLPHIGGIVDPLYEKIVSLRPDMVVTLTEHGSVRRELERLRIPSLTFHHHDTSGIIQSISVLGELTNHQDRAATLAKSLRDAKERTAHCVAGKPTPRVLVSVGGHASSGDLEKIFVAGKDTFYDELVTLAGGENAYRGPEITYPSVSPEGIVMMNPDVIIDLLPTPTDDEHLALLRKRWERLSIVPAVKHNRVVVFAEEVMVNPGPRFDRILSRFVQVIHPELRCESTVDREGAASLSPSLERSE
ncbi:MAG: ABC transporter substrate-binding protein [Bdellovibrionales bacterium]|nr:ABC transporter substrate-binding protein [Bdellovibrionales bacterium]